MVHALKCLFSYMEEYTFNQKLEKEISSTLGRHVGINDTTLNNQQLLSYLVESLDPKKEVLS